MKNLSPSLKLCAWMPSDGLIVKNTWLIGPRTSSTLPTDVLFSRKICALKCGILGFVDSQTISPSQGWTNLPISGEHVSLSPRMRYWAERAYLGWSPVGQSLAAGSRRGLRSWLVISSSRKSFVMVGASVPMCRHMRRGLRGQTYHLHGHQSRNLHGLLSRP